jgi:excisionase family DNA binding protein
VKIKDDDWRSAACLQVKTTADVLDVSVSTVWALIRTNQLETLKIGRSRRIKTPSVVRLLEREAA